MKIAVTNFFWALAGAVVFGALLLVVFHFRTGQTPTEQLALKARKVELAGQIRLELATAVEAEKSAVLAITDEESMAFADRARAAAASAETKRAALGALLETSGTSKERELLAQFSRAFSTYRHVDEELLDLAVKNTNLKASALAFGPAAQAMAAMDRALSRLLGQRLDTTCARAEKIMLLAGSAQAAALRIQVLLPPHIAEESDKKMDELEARMAKEDQEVC